MIFLNKLDFISNLEGELVTFFYNIKYFILDFINDFYTGLVDVFGEIPTNIILIAFVSLLVIYILLNIINR